MENSNKLSKKKYIEKHSLMPNKINIEKIKDQIIESNVFKSRIKEWENNDISNYST